MQTWIEYAVQYNRQLLSWLPVFVIFFLPLIYASGPLFEYEFVRLLILYLVSCLGLLGLGVEILATGQVILPQKKYLCLWLAWIGLAVLAAGFGVSPWDSFLGRYGVWVHSLVSILAFSSSGYLAFFAMHIDRQRLLNRLPIALIGAAILLVLHDMGSLIPLSSWDALTHSRLQASFRNANHLGFYLSLITVFGFNLFLHQKQKFLWGLGLVGGSVALLGLILTQSRASWFSLVIWFILVTAGKVRMGLRKVFEKKQIAVRFSKSTLVLIAIVFGLLILTGPIGYPRIVQTFQSQNQRNSLYIRLAEWQTVWRIWQDHPWFGIGVENLDLVYPRYRSVEQNTIIEEWQWRTVITRNEWLELLVATGPLGLLLFGGLGAVVLYGTPQNNHSRPFLAVISLYLVHSFFYMANVVVLSLYWISVGVCLALNQQSGTVGISQRTRWASGFLLTALGTMYILIRVLGGEWLATQAISKLEHDPVQSFTLATGSTQWNPWFDKNWRLLSLTQEELLRQNSQGVDRANLLADYLRTLQHLEKRNVKDIETLKTLTSGYMRLGGFTAKETYYKQAIDWGSQLIRLDSTSPGSWDTLGLVYLDKRDFSQARRVFHHILTTLKPDYPYALFHMGETLKQMGKPAAATAYYQKAKQLGFERLPTPSFQEERGAQQP